MSKEVGRNKWLLPGQPTMCKADRSANGDMSSSTGGVGVEIYLQRVQKRMKKRAIKTASADNCFDKLCHKS